MRNPFAGLFGRPEPNVQPDMSGEATAGFQALTSSQGVQIFHDSLSGALSGYYATRETALKISAVWACVNLIAGMVGTLPVRIVQKDDQGQVEPAKDHPLYGMLHFDPHPLYGAMVWYEGLIAWALLEGNAYALIQRDNLGQAISLLPLWDCQVEPRIVRQRIIYTVTGEAVGGQRVFDQDDILHFRGTPTIKGAKALSPLQMQARSMGIAAGADKYAEQFYEQGTQPTGIIETDKSMTTEKASGMLDVFTQKYHEGGGEEGRRRPLVLVDGAKFKSIMVDPETAQLLESRTFNTTDIARIYGVPPHMIGETAKATSWGSGIAAQTAGFNVQTLRRLFKRLEDELDRKLLRGDRREGFGVVFDLNALLRADPEARFNANRLSLGGTQAPGWMTVNEIRKQEGLPRDDDPKSDQIQRPVAKPDGAQQQPDTPPNEGGMPF